MENNTTSTANSMYKNQPREKVREYARRAGGIFQYAAAVESTIKRVMRENAYQAGREYEPFTTFASDFAIAECFGDDAILDTYNRASRSWMRDYKYYTELVLVLNHLCWFWHFNGEPELSGMYGDLFYGAKDAFYEHNEIRDTDTPEEADEKREAVDYFFQTTD